ncbi:type II toxin-antitoxin system RelE/ParE family toxin [Parapedobacter defluvii]|uniref:type II toxin-antitoxin system RelE/ParE family toxin n=1 Tax=Parapedobacter defluvii TaxID=2045106 RepID=UPI000FAD21FB|nr:MAG: type II toxin-antitoxin system RelE/ParE family toxin [Parapedobacter sp.]
MAFRILIDEDVRMDIQESIDWYNEQKQGLGKQFYTQVKATINRLRSNPFFQIRYDDVRCLPIKRFPFMIHFTVDESKKKVVVRAVFHTSRAPENWQTRKQKRANN